MQVFFHSILRVIIVRNKIAGENILQINIKGVSFNRIKYYTPSGIMEKNLLDNNAFKLLAEKYKGIYVSQPDKNTKIFAVKFKFGEDEIPFMYSIDNVTFEDGFIIIGLDKECMEYFMPVF